MLRRGLGFVVGYCRDERMVLAAAVTGAVLFAAAAVGSTYALGLLVDDVVVPLIDDDFDGSRATQVLVLVAVLAVARAMGVVLRRFSAGLLAARTKATLQRRATERLLAAPLAHVRVSATGKLLAHVDSDADAATEPLGPLPFSLGAIAIVVFAEASLVLIDPWLGLVGFVLIPLLLVMQRIHGHLVERPALAVRRSLGKVASIAHESFDGTLVVKTLGREQAEVERFGAATAELRDARIRQSIIRGVYERTLEVLPDLGVVTLVLVAAWRVEAGAISTGQLVQAVAVFGVLALPIAVAGYFFATLPPATVARERLSDVFAIETDPLLHVEATLRLRPGNLDVTVDSLTVAVEGVSLIDDVGLVVDAGETVALVGPTGSGKSTLLRAIARLIDPLVGSITIAGVPLDRIAEHDLRRRVAVAMQEPFLFGDTVERNLRLGIDPEEVDGADLDRAVTIAAAEFVDDLEGRLQAVVGERGVTLSGGQRQRVALARAMARQPGLLLLDDATSAVDPVVEQRILEQLRELETTVVVVAHRMSTIALADRVVFMTGGRVVASGTHDELLDRPDYAALVRAYESEVRA